MLVVHRLTVGGLELAPGLVQRKDPAKYVRCSHGKNILCCVHPQKSGLRVWLKLQYSDLEGPPEYARDVSRVDHWGVGDVELGIDGLDKLEDARVLIQKSFEENGLT